jgi:hypothetical protein
MCLGLGRIVLIWFLRDWVLYTQFSQSIDYQIGGNRQQMDIQKINVSKAPKSIVSDLIEFFNLSSHVFEL